MKLTMTVRMVPGSNSATWQLHSEHELAPIVMIDLPPHRLRRLTQKLLRKKVHFGCDDVPAIVLEFTPAFPVNGVGWMATLEGDPEVFKTWVLDEIAKDSKLPSYVTSW